MNHAHASQLIALFLMGAMGSLGLTGCGTGQAPDGVDESVIDPPSEPDDAEDLDPENPNPTVGGKADGLTAGWPSTDPLQTACADTAPFRTFFTPDDPVETLEMGYIDRVRAARLSTDETFEEGANPYRIRYAVYNLTHQGITQRLIEAEYDGVDVQVLIEADQLDKPWSRVAARFKAAGLQVVPAYQDLDETGRTAADLIGIREKGLMHLKIRMFETPAWSALLTGSHNPNQSAAANEENLNEITDPAVIKRYEHAYDAVRDKQPLVNVWDDDSPVNVLFSPAGEGERAATRLLDWLEAEQEQILIMVFSLRNVTSPAAHRSLVSVLKQKVEQGVPVYVITDRKQSDGIDLDGNRIYRDDWTDDRLRDAGVPVYEALNDAAGLFGGPNRYTAMHQKVAILGRTRMRVITDASNWTTSALGSWRYTERNVESMLFIDSAALDANLTGHRHLAQWMRVLMRYGHQSAAVDGERDPMEIITGLMAHPDWPETSLEFLVDAYTQYGETLYAVGDHPALGAWGRQSDGVPLTTTGETYPTWSSGSTARMPLGTVFKWKLTLHGSHGVRWESGQDRIGDAAPSPCTPFRQAQGVWR